DILSIKMKCKIFGERYAMGISLNQNALEFIQELEKVASKSTWTKHELVKKFIDSEFYHVKFESYYPSAIEKSIWWAVKRSENWVMSRSLYKIEQKEVKSMTHLDRVGNGFGIAVVEKQKEDKKEELDFATNSNEDVLDTVDISENIMHPAILSISYDRDALIRHLSEHLYEVTMLSLSIRDKGLRHYQLKKGMGENLYFLTESYFRRLGLAKTKYRMGDFITEGAKERLINRIPSGLVYEHMVPKNIYLNEFRELALRNELTRERIHHLLDKYHFICIITKEEDKLLSSTKMPDDWDGNNPFYRYEKAGIDFEPVQYEASILTNLRESVDGPHSELLHESHDQNRY
ncbi:MAG: hypothetical protein IKF69_14585, partial [Exiguobacterium sp.]|nr:hypothetical protein [Exiguobacterium sp.]